MSTEPAKLSVGETILKILNSKVGNAFLILVWPLMLAALGLPTGLAEESLALYRDAVGTETAAPEAAVECPVCDCAKAAATAEPAEVETEAPAGPPVESAPAATE